MNVVVVFLRTILLKEGQETRLHCDFLKCHFDTTNSKFICIYMPKHPQNWLNSIVINYSRLAGIKSLCWRRIGLQPGHAAGSQAMNMNTITEK